MRAPEDRPPTSGINIDAEAHGLRYELAIKLPNLHRMKVKLVIFAYDNGEGGALILPPFEAAQSNPRRVEDRPCSGDPGDEG